MATPTPTPTPTPIWNPPVGGTPSATPGWSGGGSLPGGASGGGSVGFGDVWWTPTPYPTSAATPALQLTIPVRTLPDEIVQGYNMLNQQSAFDMVWFVVLVGLIIGGVLSVNKRLSNL